MLEPPYRTKNFVIGTIILWFGAIGTIPSGWHLCDGQMGTPNLLNRWIVGAGDTYAVGDTSNSQAHAHKPVADNEVAAGIGRREKTSWFYQQPPYHALCYIMKVN